MTLAIAERQQKRLAQPTARRRYEGPLRKLAGELAYDRESLTVLRCRPAGEHRADRIAELERDIARKRARFNMLLAEAQNACMEEGRYV